jgi:hypothetical protein
MLRETDLAQLQNKGISISKVEEQLNAFKTDFPFLKIIKPATPDSGIKVLVTNEVEKLKILWNETLAKGVDVLKFVPASGAASRMFKDLFEFIEGNSEVPSKPAEIKFFNEIDKFAFYEKLSETCKKNTGSNIEELISHGAFKIITKQLLTSEGLNYGYLPKGLLLFHSYADGKRTPLEEHLAEGAMYAADHNKIVKIHFTVSAEHRILFEKLVSEIKETYEKKFGVKYSISFSEQKPSTDTIAADHENEPFRENGELVFRPGGHGALIENLNDLEADVIFIKNIDNIVPDKLKDITVTYKKVIAGLLIQLQQQSFTYLKELENKDIADNRLEEIALFCEKELLNLPERKLKGQELRAYLIKKLNRPIRVCGMVKNTGEPGGGPFLTVNSDSTVSLQILESSQINLADPAEKEKMMQSTHFNPVDLVCGVRDYKGEKFDLLKYVDKNTGFISIKSKNGKELKALELPGLWNGAMSDWNTVFVEVPIETFNPVKTVNDLLRPEHQ